MVRVTIGQRLVSISPVCRVLQKDCYHTHHMERLTWKVCVVSNTMTASTVLPHNPLVHVRLSVSPAPDSE